MNNDKLNFLFEVLNKNNGDKTSMLSVKQINESFLAEIFQYLNYIEHLQIKEIYDESVAYWKNQLNSSVLEKLRAKAWLLSDDLYPSNNIFALIISIIIS